MFLIFDTETTGLPKRWDAPISDSDNWPRLVQIAWQLHDQQGHLIAHEDYLVSPSGYTIPFNAEQIHGISTKLAEKQGKPLSEVIEAFNQVVSVAQFVVGQNIGFDLNIVAAEYNRLDKDNPLQEIPVLDTCTEKTAALCRLSGGKGGKYKLPTLTELHNYLFKESFPEAHNAIADVKATARCFFELIRINRGFEEENFGILNYFENFKITHPKVTVAEDIPYINLKEASESLRKSTQQSDFKEVSEHNSLLLEETPFVHLHNHTQFTILQSTIKIPELIAATAERNMPAVAITDTANLMGAFNFVREVNKYNTSEQGQTAPIKPVVGCEFYICDDRHDRTRKDLGYKMVFLAKNKKGYHHLSKMSSIAYSEGFYYVPRIDREVVTTYKEDLIVLTGDSSGEIATKILNVGEHQAEEALLWWKTQFGDNLYIELTNHGNQEDKLLNDKLYSFSKKYQIKVIATNSTYYINKEDAEAQDILLCVKAGEKKVTPIGRGRDYRHGMPTQEYYFKSSEEMKELFRHIPKAIINITEILDKIESFELGREVLLPKFDIPKYFDAKEKNAENAYLKHLTYKGSEHRYPDLSDTIRERIDFELEVIKNSGYPGYFLIVQDFIAQAKQMGVSVGPGRGSAAGSVVAYCLGITNVDPITYNLLFERFLNPDRVSLPDIDIDFDDEGRSKVIDYVINKYGSNQVAQIITYGTMAGRSAIRDTARVLDLPINEANMLSKLVPARLSLEKIFEQDIDSLRKDSRSEDMEQINILREIVKGDDLRAKTLRQARVIEGSLRNTGVHACGIIITPGDMTDYVPIINAKDTEMLVTQYDNNVVEDAGLLKMDFLGVKTLSLIKSAVEIIYHRHGTRLDPDKFPLDNIKTYELFQRGDTVGIFQYESTGMQKYMTDLKPTVFEDLIAINALYRPGPMDYLPSFIRRKHGEEPITYDIDDCKDELEETYGITVYQEQVMRLSQQLGGFSKGEADILRKAMGKKQIALLSQLKSKFIEGGTQKGHPKETLDKIWKDWEAFASYAFNKSHATCYAIIGYQTAYLKANYPQEYMAAVLSHNMSDVSKVSFFLEECHRMNIAVLPPDVNESLHQFTVNKDKSIRVGLGAIKGVGKGAVETIIVNRKEEPYRSVFDVVKRIDLRAANKRSLESLVLAGAFDGFLGVHRRQYLIEDNQGIIYLEKLIRYGANYQANKNASQLSLFGDESSIQIPEPEIPPCEPWTVFHTLEKEKEVIGIYISAHPLDSYRLTLKHCCYGDLSLFNNMKDHIKKEFCIGGMITEVSHAISRNNKGWAKFMLSEYISKNEFRIFDEAYKKHKHYLEVNELIYIRLKIVEGWMDKNTGQRRPPRIEYLQMGSLSDLLDSYVKQITIYCEANMIDENLISTLKEQLLSTTTEGSKHLEFIVRDKPSNTSVTLSNSSYKVAVDKNLLKLLDKKEINYKLN